MRAPDEVLRPEGLLLFDRFAERSVRRPPLWRRVRTRFPLGTAGRLYRRVSSR